MVDTFLIPFANTPQEFNITLGNRDLTIVNKYCDALDGSWVIDIIDSISNVPLIMCIPLVAGVNLLEQYDYIGLYAKLVVYTDGDASAIPTRDNLGVDSNVYYQAKI